MATKFEFVFSTYSNPGSLIQKCQMSVEIWAEDLKEGFQTAQKALDMDLKDPKIYLLEAIYEIATASSRYVQVSPFCGYAESHKILLTAPREAGSSVASCREAIDLLKKHGRPEISKPESSAAYKAGYKAGERSEMDFPRSKAYDGA